MGIRFQVRFCAFASFYFLFTVFWFFNTLWNSVQNSVHRTEFSVIFIQHLLTFCQLTFPLLETNNGPKRLRVFRVFYARRVKTFFSISVWVIMFICSIALSHLGPSHLMMWITPQNFLPFTIKMAADIGSNKGEEVTSTKRDKQSKSNKNTHLNDDQNKMSA